MGFHTRSKLIRLSKTNNLSSARTAIKPQTRKVIHWIFRPATANVSTKLGHNRLGHYKIDGHTL